MFPKKKIFDKVFTREVIAGCSIPVVRVHGVDIDRVRFPAARKKVNVNIAKYALK